MKTIFKTIVYIFSIFGLCFAIFFFYQLRKHQNKCKQYLENCHKIKKGVDLSTARYILGEFDDDGYYLFSIEPSFDIEKKQYLLTYPIANHIEGGVIIKFNPNTLIVESCNCGYPN